MWDLSSAKAVLALLGLFQSSKFGVVDDSVFVDCATLSKKDPFFCPVSHRRCVCDGWLSLRGESLGRGSRDFSNQSRTNGLKGLEDLSFATAGANQILEITTPDTSK